jgi:hypothetical protein
MAFKPDGTQSAGISAKLPGTRLPDEPAISVQYFHRNLLHHPNRWPGPKYEEFNSY